MEDMKNITRVLFIEFGEIRVGSGSTHRPVDFGIWPVNRGLFWSRQVASGFVNFAKVAGRP